MKTRTSPGFVEPALPSQDPAGNFKSPQQLPMDIPDFTAREDESRLLRRLLRAGPSNLPPVVVISGRGGIGKTALALHVAHGLSSCFPDGQLFANLGGFDKPQDPASVLSAFLRALDVDSHRVPDDISERASLFRSVLASRRVLVVLDDAVNERQVRLLLPGRGSSAMIVTSRDRLDSLESACTMDLGLLSTTDSLSLLECLITARRVRAEHDAAKEIVRHCGGLPLAVRIAGARVTARPNTSLRSYARGLADERHRLDRLEVGDLEVRASIGMSYTALAPDDRLALRRLVLLGSGSFSAWVIAPVANVNMTEAAMTAERLADRRMLEIVGSDPCGEPRYRLHDLVRLFLSERTEQEDRLQERTKAMERLLGLWLLIAEAITENLPSVPDQAIYGEGPRWNAEPDLRERIGVAPRCWFAAERNNMAAAVQLAEANGLHGYVWQIAAAMTSPCLLYGSYDLLSQVLERARVACQAAEARRGEAAILTSIGRLKGVFHENEEASRLHKVAYDRFGEADDLAGQTFAAIFVADTLRMLYQYDSGCPLDDVNYWASICSDLSERLDNDYRRADEACVASKVSLVNGDLRRAHQHARRMLEISRAVNKPVGQAHALFQIGHIARKLRQYSEALAAYRRALAITGELGDREGVAFITFALAETAAETGDKVAAVEGVHRAMLMLDDLGLTGKIKERQRRLADLILDRAMDPLASRCDERHEQTDVPDSGVASR
jgi:tetratricopeptide (TPR) repeat protein